MEKRVIIAIILCVGVLMTWSKVFPPPAPQAPPAAPTAPAPTPGAPAAPTPGAPAAGTPTAPAPTPGAPAAAPVNQPERLLALDSDDVHFVFSTVGGSLKEARLREEKYRDKPDDPASGHQLVASDADGGAFRTTFPKAAFPAPGPWQASQPTPDSVLFVAESDAVRIEKRYRLDKTRYRLHLDVVVQNKSNRNQDVDLVLHLLGRQDPEKKGGGFFTGGAANLSSMLCAVNDKVERTPIEKLQKDKLEERGIVRWLGTDEKFFLLAAVPYPEKPAREQICVATSPDGQVGEGRLIYTSRPLPPGGSAGYAFAVFAGPKFIADLKAVQPAGVEVGLDKAVDIDWLAQIARVILALLKFFHGFTHNWGVAIILLTVFIKLLTFYPTQKALLSAKKMQKLGPKMNAIRKKYENDRQRQSVETMNLYKAHGVSPFGGCLPSLIQMPIWIALYSTLNYAVELYRAPFILHIKDLTAMDPFHIGPLPLPITPLLMGGVMFLQMKMSPASPDNQQQAMMQIMMPVMFTAFSLVLPSGLAIYMLTSYLIGILQQLYVNRLDRKASAPA